MNIIAKFLLNSLYGRFGIKPLIDNHVIADIADLGFYIDNFTVLDAIDLDNSKVLIKYSQYPESEMFYELEQNTNYDISLPIAIFTTSYGRIAISKYFNNPNIKIFYTDTDSIDFQGDLNQNLIGDELGKLKIEAVFSRAVYLAPKLYFTESIKNNILKIKNKARGLKNSDYITVDKAYSLLKRDSIITINQVK
jgi:hypothetical protein